MSGESELDDALLKPNMAPKRVFSRNRCYFIGCGLITIVIIAMIVVIAILAVRLRQAEGKVKKNYTIPMQKCNASF